MCTLNNSGSLCRINLKQQSWILPNGRPMNNSTYLIKLKQVMPTITLLVLLITTHLFAGEGDTVIVTVTTKTHNGQYAPRNATMIWIQKSDKTFIKTILKRAATYIRYCTLWNSISKGDVDGLTGASRNNHTGALTARWDCTGQDGKPVPAGSYEFWVEMTESNATGKNSFGTITIDGSSETVTGTETAYFTGFTAAYKAKPTALFTPGDLAARRNITITKNNKHLQITFPRAGYYSAALISPAGKQIHTIQGYGVNALVPANDVPPGIYIIATTMAGVKNSISYCIGF